MNDNAIKNLLEELYRLDTSLRRIRKILEDSLAEGEQGTDGRIVLSQLTEALSKAKVVPVGSPPPVKLHALADDGPAGGASPGVPVTPAGNEAVPPTPEDDGKLDGGTSSGGILDVLDLSGDIKKVHLALMRLGEGTLDGLIEETGLEADELRTYLKTLEREGSIVCDRKAEGGPTYRPVMRRKTKRGAESLLDKLA